MLRYASNVKCADAHITVKTIMLPVFRDSSENNINDIACDV